MKIPPTDLDRMFQIANVDRKALYCALREYGDKGVHNDYKALWSADNPTRGYCYVVTQFVQYLDRTPSEVRPYEIRNIAGEAKAHWLLRWSDGSWVDLTAEQFGEEYDRKFPNGYGYRAVEREFKSYPKSERLFKLYQKHLGNASGSA